MVGCMANGMVDTTLRKYEFEDGLWIRCNSRGTFLNSSTLKDVAEEYLRRGGTHVVIDLELCPGVDSTFMGTIAWVAKHCTAGGGSTEVVGATERARSAMECLGLDMMIEIDSPTAAWRTNLAERREVLNKQEPVKIEEENTAGEEHRTKHVLNAHNTLRSMNSKNEETFGYVCEALEEDLRRREKSGSEESVEDDEK